MVKKSQMPHLRTMDALSAEKVHKGHGEGDICALPGRIGMGRREEKGKVSHWKNKATKVWQP